MKKKRLKFLITLGVMALFAWGCEQDFEPLLEEEKVGTITLVGYAQDTLQFFTQGDTLVNYSEVDYPKPNYYINNIAVSKSFALAEGESETLKVIHWETGEVLATYESLFARPKQDTISFFSFGNESYIEGVLDFEAGTLSETNHVGYKFIFPKPNLYSNSVYEGELEAVLYQFDGEEIGRTTIGKDEMGGFIDFPFPDPQVIELRIVKAGTDEKYVEADPVYLDTGQEGNSFMYVLYEETDGSGNFDGIALLDLAEYFDSFPQNEGGGNDAFIPIWQEGFDNGIPSTWQVVDNTPYSLIEDEPSYTWEPYITSQGADVVRIQGFVTSDFQINRSNDYLISEAIDLTEFNGELNLVIEASALVGEELDGYDLAEDSDETLGVYAYTARDTLSLVNNGYLGTFHIDEDTEPFEQFSFSLPETLQGQVIYVGVRYVLPHDIFHFNEMYREGTQWDTPYSTYNGLYIDKIKITANINDI